MAGPLLGGGPAASGHAGNGGTLSGAGAVAAFGICSRGYPRAAPPPGRPKAATPAPPGRRRKPPTRHKVLACP